MFVCFSVEKETIYDVRRLSYLLGNGHVMDV